MHSFIIDIRHLSRKAVLTALLGHILVLGFFSLTITARRSQPKPQLTFLGAILQKQDLLNVAAEQNHKNIKLNTAFSLGATEEPSVPTAMDKPAFSQQATGQQKKIFLKSTAPEPEPDTTPQTETPGGAQSEESPPAYTPLKLYQDDQN